MTGTDARELVIQLGDAHVCRDHVDALKAQLERAPKRFSTI
jgi:thymidylate synthase